MDRLLNTQKEQRENHTFIKKIPLISGGGKVEEYDIQECFSHRRSRREFWPGAMTKRQLSYILWHTARIQKEVGDQTYTPIPSGGNLHPLSVSIALLNILDMEKGIYEYSPKDHCLYLIERRENMKQGIKDVFQGQDFVANASFVYGISGDEKKVKNKFPDHWEKLMLLEAGHLGQQIMLACESLHLGTCPIGIFDPLKGQEFFKSKGTLIYCFPVGINP
ncbi:MAG: SagB/ThcOx family dehydrogenase [Tissierellia bacterium]|nr:SagB/ThcOx family dehydrogenase [Tissierellia bacterium]